MVSANRRNFARNSTCRCGSCQNYRRTKCNIKDSENKGADMTHTYEDIPPLKVHITGDDRPKKRPKECRVSHRTFVLTASNPAQMICGVDPARYEVRLEVQENQAILTSSTGQANDIANTTAGLATPNGRILSSVIGEYVIPGGANEVWLT